MRCCVLFVLLSWLNMGIAQETENEVILLGEQHFSELFENKSFPWFKSGVTQYSYDPLVLEDLKSFVSSGIHFVVFAGSWCEDTRLLLPQFFKAVFDAGFNERDVSLYMLDRKKTCPTKNEEGFHITNLPTFIVYRNGKEIGRVVEHVNRSIEADLLEILRQP